MPMRVLRAGNPERRAGIGRQGKGTRLWSALREPPAHSKLLMKNSAKTVPFEQKAASNAEVPREGIEVLNRTLGVGDAVLLILSSVIGVGIFLTPKEIAVQVGNPYWFLLLWLLGALVAMSGAMSSAALGTMMPWAGGDYAFLKHTYGRSWGFLYGYLCFTATFTGSIAAYATGVMHYQGRTIFGEVVAHQFRIGGMPVTVEQVAAVLLVMAFTLVNHFGTRKSLHLQKFITAMPLLFLIGAGLMIVVSVATDGGGAGSQLVKNFSGVGLSDVPPLSAMAMAMIPIFFTYSGWNAALYLGEDIKQPEKIIPQALTIGIAIVAIVYLLFCTVVLSTIPYAVLHAPDRSLDIASHAWGFLFGAEAQILMAILIAVLILGSLNSSIIAGSRIYFAMARDGMFFSQAARIHPRHGTPSRSLWMQAAWASLIILFVGEFQTILEYTTIVITFMSIMTISSIFVLRRNLARGGGRVPERTLGYPLMPFFYVVSTTAVLAGFVLHSHQNMIKALVGAGIVVFGFLVYWVWHHSNDFLRGRRGREPRR